MDDNVYSLNKKYLKFGSCVSRSVAQIIRASLTIHYLAFVQSQNVTGRAVSLNVYSVLETGTNIRNRNDNGNVFKKHTVATLE